MNRATSGGGFGPGDDAAVLDSVVRDGRAIPPPLTLHHDDADVGKQFDIVVDDRITLVVEVREFADAPRRCLRDGLDEFAPASAKIWKRIDRQHAWLDRLLGDDVSEIERVGRAPGFKTGFGTAPGESDRDLERVKLLPAT